MGCCCSKKKNDELSTPRSASSTPRFHPRYNVDTPRDNTAATLFQVPDRTPNVGRPSSVDPPPTDTDTSRTSSAQSSGQEGGNGSSSARSSGQEQGNGSATMRTEHLGELSLAPLGSQEQMDTLGPMRTQTTKLSPDSEDQLDYLGLPQMLDIEAPPREARGGGRQPGQRARGGSEQRRRRARLGEAQTEQPFFEPETPRGEGSAYESGASRAGSSRRSVPSGAQQGGRRARPDRPPGLPRPPPTYGPSPSLAGPSDTPSSRTPSRSGPLSTRRPEAPPSGRRGTPASDRLSAIPRPPKGSQGISAGRNSEAARTSRIPHRN